MSVSEGRNRRDAGISRVLTPEQSWRQMYRDVVLAWINNRPVGHKFTGETLRLVAKHCGVPDPHHHNAWGGVASGLLREWLKDGRIRVSGLASASDDKAHARRYPQYEIAARAPCV